MDALPKAHFKISTGECKSFEDSLYQFSDTILKDIVLVRLNELIKNPEMKR